MKLSVLLQLLDLGLSAGLLERVISSLRGLYLYTNTEKPTHNKTLNIHALSGIRTHGPGVRASEDSSCLRPRGYRDRLGTTIPLPLRMYFTCSAYLIDQEGFKLWNSL
jgi:hypothetical protein